MNNNHFRKLVLDTPARQDGANSSPRPGATPSTLGSKRTSFVPMTPRSVRGNGGGGNDFARQVAERNAASQGSKKFRSTVAPKGSRLASGFNDRTQERRDLESDEKGARILALEEQMKLGQLDQRTFEALRDQITGGDVSATHLVKGLDRKLLKRVRKGEDVLGTGRKNTDEHLDEEFDELEEKEVAPIQREQPVKKKGEMAPPPPVAGAKRSRDAIMAELKAQRKAQAEARLAARPELGSKFRHVGASKAESRVERDEKGREVMITVDEHGNVKKKVRKVHIAEPTKESPGLSDKSVKFLDEGITIPVPQPAKKVPESAEDSDDDIFEGAGTAYDPLAGIDDDDDDSSSDEEGESIVKKPSTSPEVKEGEVSSKPTSPNLEEGKVTSPKQTSPQASSDATSMPPSQPPSSTTSMPPPPPPTAPTARRNYFSTPTLSTSSEEDPNSKNHPFNDTAFLAAIKKAGSLHNISLSLGASDPSDPTSEESTEAKEARLQKRAQMLASSDRDFEDMDLGFGGSRFGDEEVEDGGKIKLSEWKGGKGDEHEEDGKGKGKGNGGKGKGKGKGRRRLGDKNSAKDVLGVMERRKEGK